MNAVTVYVLTSKSCKVRKKRRLQNLVLRQILYFYKVKIDFRSCMHAQVSVILDEG
jgi:hypothetical protein